MSHPNCPPMYNDHPSHPQKQAGRVYQLYWLLVFFFFHSCIRSDASNIGFTIGFIISETFFYFPNSLTLFLCFTVFLILIQTFKNITTIRGSSIVCFTKARQLFTLFCSLHPPLKIQVDTYFRFPYLVKDEFAFMYEM